VELYCLILGVKFFELDFISLGANCVELDCIVCGGNYLELERLGLGANCVELDCIVLGCKLSWTVLYRFCGGRFFGTGLYRF
jgi:hypothetical protein